MFVDGACINSQLDARAGWGVCFGPEIPFFKMHASSGSASCLFDRALSLTISTGPCSVVRQPQLLVRDRMPLHCDLHLAYLWV